MINLPTLIILTGFPGSGKSTFSNKISKFLNLPLISKDEFKELFFDILGCNSISESQKLGKVSSLLLWNVAKKILMTNSSLVIESNFDAKLAEIDLNILKSKINFKVIQIKCTADKELLINRVISRVLSNQRHIGHQDSSDFDTVKNLHFNKELDWIDIECKRIEYNTNVFSEIKESEILALLSKEINLK